MAKPNTRARTSAEQVADQPATPVSHRMQKRIKEESGEGQPWNNGFLDGGELDDWLTAEDEIDHFVHNRQ